MNMSWVTSAVVYIFLFAALLILIVGVSLTFSLLVGAKEWRDKMIDRLAPAFWCLIVSSAVASVILFAARWVSTWV